MRAVKGAVVASKSFSLAKAAAILGRFAESETAARPDIAVYIRRASAAFEELVEFHREIKRPRAEKEEKSEEKKKDKRRKDQWVGLEDVGGMELSGRVNEQEIEAGVDGDEDMGRRRKKRKRKVEAERIYFDGQEEERMLGGGGGEGLERDIGDFGDGDLVIRETNGGLEEMTERREKKRKEEVEEERFDFGEEEKKVWVGEEEEEHEGRRKTAKRREKREDQHNGDGLNLIEGRRNGDFDTGKRDLTNQQIRHTKEKRKKHEAEG